MLQLLNNKIIQLHQTNDELYLLIRFLLRDQTNEHYILYEARKLEREIRDNNIRIEIYKEIINLITI